MLLLRSKHPDVLQPSAESRCRLAHSLVKVMLVLIVLLGSWMILRGIGAPGVTALASWHDSVRYALALMFVFTATAHFNKMKHDLARMIPSFFPRLLWLVYLTGVLELLGAAGLLLPKFRLVAGVCLIALLCGMFICESEGKFEGHNTARKTAYSTLAAYAHADSVRRASLVVHEGLNQKCTATLVPINLGASFLRTLRGRSELLHRTVSYQTKSATPFEINREDTTHTQTKRVEAESPRIRNETIRNRERNWMKVTGF